MTLIDRKTIVDRPELVDRGDSEDDEDTEEVIEELGEGDGPEINGIKFEQGDYGVVAASNLVAVLSTAQTEGEEFQQAFMTSAIQMKEMVNKGIDIGPIARMSRSRGIDDLNVSQQDLGNLKLPSETQTPESQDESVQEADEDEESNYQESEDVEETDEDNIEKSENSNDGEETS